MKNLLKKNVRRVFVFTSLLIACLATHSPTDGSNSLLEPFRFDRGLAIIKTPQGQTIFAEIADTPEKRSQGLMFRASLAPDHGMLFTFPDSGYWTFWMKNTKISLDIIWLDSQDRVVDIQYRVPICERSDDFCPRYTPGKEAFSVLELKAGQAQKFDIRTGTRLFITLP